jgi:hypothetical protein
VWGWRRPACSCGEGYRVGAWIWDWYRGAPDHGSGLVESRYDLVVHSKAVQQQAKDDRRAGALEGRSVTVNQLRPNSKLRATGLNTVAMFGYGRAPLHTCRG